MNIVSVGAGLAGPTCAKVLRERGAEVAVFEASDDTGGRVRTDEPGRLSEIRTQAPGLVLAGKHTENASVNGSTLSGEKAAEAVIA
jgi:flavin-dependent dehydrogenase